MGGASQPDSAFPENVLDCYSRNNPIGSSIR
jgi:hypothetical protein